MSISRMLVLFLQWVLYLNSVRRLRGEAKSFFWIHWVLIAFSLKILLMPKWPNLGQRALGPYTARLSNINWCTITKGFSFFFLRNNFFLKEKKNKEWVNIQMQQPALFIRWQLWVMNSECPWMLSAEWHFYIMALQSLLWNQLLQM